MFRAVRPAWRQSAGDREAESARTVRPGHRFRCRAPRRPGWTPPPRRTTAARAPWRTASPTRTRRWRASRVAEAVAPHPVAPGQLVTARTALAPARPGLPGPTSVGTAVGEDRRLPGEPAPPGSPDEHPVVSRDGHGVREVGSFAALPGSTEPLPTAPTRLQGLSTSRQATLRRSGATAGRAAGAAVTRVAVRTRYVVRLGSTTGSPSVILPLACSASHSAVGSAA